MSGVEKKVAKVKERAGVVELLPGQLGLDAKIAMIRKKIAMSRDRAGVVWASISPFSISPE